MTGPGSKIFAPPVVFVNSVSSLFLSFSLFFFQFGFFFLKRESKGNYFHFLHSEFPGFPAAFALLAVPSSVRRSC